MGLVDRDDGWRLPDWLWGKVEPLLPTRPEHPVLTVALVNRWWALSIALVPFAVLFFLHSATDYVYPYHEDSYPVIAVSGTVFLLGISSLGFLLHTLFDRAVSKTWLPRLRDARLEIGS